MAVVLFAQSITGKLDSLITGKLFVSLLIYSFAKSGFENKHFLLKKIPLLSNVFGLIVAIFFLIVLAVFSILSPIYSLIKNAFSFFASKKFTFKISFRAYHFAMAMGLVAFLFWVVV